MDLHGKIALITGASGGIGEGIARGLARHGAHVALAGRRADRLDAVASAIHGHGGSAEVFAGELRDDDYLLTLAEEVDRRVGPVDVLVNNAGVANLAPAHELTPPALDEEIAVNLRAPMLLTATVLPGMRTRGYGRIVNVSSEAGVFAYAEMAAYSATKRALIAYTEVVQAENAEHGIKAWALCPGMVDTDMGDDRGRGRRELFLQVSDVVDVVESLLAAPERAHLGPQVLLRTQRNPWKRQQAEG